MSGETNLGFGGAWLYVTTLVGCVLAATWITACQSPQPREEDARDADRGVEEAHSEQLRTRTARELAALPVIADSSRGPSECYVEIHCDSTTGGRAVALLAWESSGDLLERIDVTTFKRGFEQEMYTCLDPAGRGEDAMFMGAERGLRKSDLEALRVRGVFRTSFKEGRELFDAQLRSGEATDVIEMENLEPGLNYSFRVCRLNGNEWHASPISSALVPVCPGDEVERD